ncbi:MAG: sugar phosphate isomerase/epimerase family protein [Caldilineaceae bacterium]
MYRNLNTGAIGVKATLPQAVQLASAHGFAGIDFSIEEAQTIANEHGLDHLRGLFNNAGIKPGSFGFPVDFRRDDATWRTGLDKLAAQAALAVDLGCLRTATWIMPCDNTRNFATYFRVLVNRLRPAAQILADYGIRFGLEFIGPKTLRETQRFNFVHTMDGMLAVCAAIDTGNMGLLLDIFHLWTGHGTNDDVRRLSNADVVTVHVNDARTGRNADEQIDQERALPGATGVMDLAGFVQALHAIGYDGPVTAEPFDKTLATLSADEAVAKTAASMQSIGL